MNSEFKVSKDLPISTVFIRITGRVRAERQKLGLSQKEFSSRCGIPLRTYKRFELGQCDSLEVFLRIIKEFDRLTAVELLFPPQMTLKQFNDPSSLLARAIDRLKQSQ